MRSTRATAAVERLKTRSGDRRYAMVRSADGLFYLVLAADMEAPEKLSEPMEQDAFVKFVNDFGPQQPRKASRLDIEFEKQLVKKRTPPE